MDVKITTPKEGWVEQDPLLILETVRRCAEIACGKLSALSMALKKEYFEEKNLISAYFRLSHQGHCLHRNYESTGNHDRLG